MERISALRRWSGLLNAARAGDIPVILAGLSDDDLATLVEVADPPVRVAICEHVLGRGSTAALIALARRAALDECEQGEQVLYPYYRLGLLGWLTPFRRRRARRTNLVPRILRHRDPEVDAAFFDLDETLKPVATARAAILSDRRGKDGRASIPPQVKKRLLDAAAEHARHSGSGLPPRLLSELATADDADLVSAVLPYQRALTDDEKALVVDTLVRHGREREAKHQYPDLWSGVPRAARRAARRRVKQAGYSYRGPAGPAVLSVGQYIKETGQKDQRERNTWLLRQFALDGLRAGTLTAADVIAHSRPAAVALTLACCTGRDDQLPGARRAVDDVRCLLAERLTEAVGDDPRRWTALISHAAGFRGTFPELLACLDRGFPSQSYPYHDQSAFGPLNATSVLVAMAPREVVEDLLEDPSERGRRLRDHLAAGAPLTRRLVDHFLESGKEHRTALARNDATPDSVLARLLEDTELVGIIAQRRYVAPEVRFGALVRHGYDKSRGLSGHPILELAKRGPEPLLSTLRSATDPVQLLAFIEAVASSLRPDIRVAAYSILATAVGPEAVWAVELDRAGSLEEMQTEVRASMAAGTAEPLHRAAADIPRVRDAESVSGSETWRADVRLDEPFGYPLETLVRAHLDGHPERWLALVELMTAEPETEVQDLVGRVAIG